MQGFGVRSPRRALWEFVELMGNEKHLHAFLSATHDEKRRSSAAFQNVIVIASAHFHGSTNSVAGDTSEVFAGIEIT